MGLHKRQKNNRAHFGGKGSSPGGKSWRGELPPKGGDMEGFNAGKKFRGGKFLGRKIFGPLFLEILGGGRERFYALGENSFPKISPPFGEPPGPKGRFSPPK